MKSLFLAGFLGLVVLSLIGCSTTSKYKFETDPNADLTAYSSFAMMPLPDSIPNADPGVILRLGPTALETIQSELVARGYKQAELGEADFAVKITGKIVPKVDVTDWGYQPYSMYARPSRWGTFHPYAMGYREVDVDQYDEGTTIVEFYDAKTKKLVWVGWTSARARSGGPDIEKFKEALVGIMTNVPSKLAPVVPAAE